MYLGEASKLTDSSPHIKQPAAANLYRKSYKYQLNTAALWLQLILYGRLCYTGVTLWNDLPIDLQNQKIGLSFKTFRYILYITINPYIVNQFASRC